MPITSRFVVRSTIGLLAVGFAALLGIIGMTMWLGERAQVYFNDAIEARDTRGSAVELRNAVQTAESSQRGFLVTGNEIYLAPYGSAKALALRQLDALRRTLRPYADSEVMLSRLSDDRCGKIRRDGPDHRAQERTARRRCARAVPHQSRQGADGRGERVPLRHHQRRRRAPHRRRERAARQRRDAALGLDRRRHRDRAGGRRRDRHRGALHPRDRARRATRCATSTPASRDG